MIQLTAAAQHEVIRLSQRAKLDSPHVHLGIAPGGCLEQMYVLEVRAIATEDSVVVSSASDQGQPLQISALQISVSADHRDSLEQLTLDYSEDLMGGTFRFVNPKASQTCSCGQSFSMAKADPNGPDDT